jgi:hypothetical protein
MPIVTPLVLVELNGADPINVVCNLPGIRVDVLDWDEVRKDVISNEELILIHDTWENKSPATARSIRDYLRMHGVTLPAQYDNEKEDWHG